MVIESTLCAVRNGQFGTTHKFAPHKCVNRYCEECRKWKLKMFIQDMNAKLLDKNPNVTYHHWQKMDGKTVPKKCEFKRPLKTVVNTFIDIIDDLSSHLFRSSWHRQVFQYAKHNLMLGFLLQVIDFAMNFNNHYQDKIQPAYWGRSQTTIHVTINFLRCSRTGCNQLVTFCLVHITDDLKNDSFLA